jgi:CheY-like chemotaxis protein
VTLVLPRCLGAPAAPVPEPPRRPGAGAGRKVLLVEDDPVVGPVMAAAIEDIGYAVTRATSADEALALFARGEPVDVLFSDIVMPGAMSGVDLAREARRLRPGLPVLLTSGYSEGTAAAKEFRILAKPYRTETLAQALAEVAAEPGGGEARGGEARPAPA